jgi:2-dehydropantoate 2-reductase
MQIAILGPGGIGSTFAFQLSRAGHDVTVIARGKRLAQLQADAAIVTGAGERAAVKVLGALDPSMPFDLVLVSVLSPQVDAVLPALTASSAKTVMFMFNTFEPLSRLREAVGEARFAFGFPAILATLDDGKLNAKIINRGQTSITSDPTWARVFTEAGITTAVEPHMESWLRTHAAFVVPFMVGAATAYTRKAGLSWRESFKLSRAMNEGFTLVRRLGNTLTPLPMAVMSWLPSAGVAALLWGATRVPALRNSGVAGGTEPRALIDSMQATAPGQVPTLLEVRP